MPTDDRVRLDDSQPRTPVAKPAGEANLNQAVAGSQPGMRDAASQDGDLVAQGKVFGGQAYAAGQQDAAEVEDGEQARH